MSSKLRIPLLAVVTGALLAAGCGGNGDDTSSATAWADEVCSAMSTWIGSVSSATESLGEGGLSQDGLENAADDVQDATQTLTDELEEAGRPDTDSGQQAETAIEELADDIDENVRELQSAVEGISGAEGVLDAISVITGTLSTMANRVGETFEELGQLDAAGELQDAFEESDDCSDLRSSQ